MKYHNLGTLKHYISLDQTCDAHIEKRLVFIELLQ